MIIAIGAWAHRKPGPAIALGKLGNELLMWKVRRKIGRSFLPQRRTLVECILSRDEHSVAKCWLFMRPGRETDL